MAMKNRFKAFGRMLASYRSRMEQKTGEYHSVREVGRLAEVPYSNISAWETGASKRGCGSVSAEKLANALQLTDEERLEFYKMAAQTCVTPRLPADSSGYPLILSGMVAKKLLKSGVKPNDIKQVQATQSQKDNLDSEKYFVHLKDGRKYFIDFKMKEM